MTRKWIWWKRISVRKGKERKESTKKITNLLSNTIILSGKHWKSKYHIRPASIHLCRIYLPFCVYLSYPKAFWMDSLSDKPEMFIKIDILSFLRCCFYYMKTNDFCYTPAKQSRKKLYCLWCQYIIWIGAVFLINRLWDVGWKGYERNDTFSVLLLVCCGAVCIFLWSGGSFSSF